MNLKVKRGKTMNNNGYQVANNPSISSDKIDCCHLYYECSLVKRCISTNPGIVSACTYKTKLEAGLIFYSKNANNFDINKFAEIQTKYNSLDDEAKKGFNYILHFFVKDKRGYDSAFFIRNSILQSLLLKKLLFEIKIEPAELLNKFSMRYLKKSLTQKIKLVKKVDIVNYILEYDKEALNKLNNSCVELYFNLHDSFYFEELYIDNQIEKTIVPIEYKLYISSITPTGMVKF